MSHFPVVAIDGAAGSGKSTLARALATELGWSYVNTGLMYRALAAAALRAGVDLDDDVALTRVTERLRFRMRDTVPPELEVEGWTDGELTDVDVEAQVSRAARHPMVRELMRGLQRELGSREATVMEGRDIGTVVFPEAAVKIFLAADPRERGARRLGERGATHDVADALRVRDALDARVNPLVPASDASVIDSTHLSPQETLSRALAIVRERLQ